jgi:hypothetical protein
LIILSQLKVLLLKNRKDWEKLFIIHTPKKEILSTIYKESLHSLRELGKNIFCGDTGGLNSGPHAYYIGAVTI